MIVNHTKLEHRPIFAVVAVIGKWNMITYQSLLQLYTAVSTPIKQREVVVNTFGYIFCCSSSSSVYYSSPTTRKLASLENLVPISKGCSFEM